MSTDVSVIIAAYNASSSLTRAVDSALTQDGVSVEVIIVDDCSADETWKIASRLSEKDPRIHAVQTEKNSGPGAARNMALEAATGKWVAVLDGDDAFEADRLQTILSALNNAEADIAVDNLLVYEVETGKHYPMFTKQDWPPSGVITLDAYISGNLFSGSGFTLGYTKPVIKRSFIEEYKLRYPEDIRIGEDYIFMADALAYGGQCVFIEKPGYIYSVHSTSISHRLSSDHVARIIEHDKKFVARHTLDTKSQRAQRLRQTSLNDIYAFSILVESIKNKDMRGLVRALWLSPTCPRHLSAAIKKRLKKVVPS